MVGENESYGAEAALHEIQKGAISDIMRETESDAELLKILNDRIVTLAPDAYAVEHAVGDIRDLAKSRAES